MLELENELSNPEITNNREKLLKLSKERSELYPVVETFDEFSSVSEDILVAEDWLNDPDLRQEAQTELESLKTNLSLIEEKLHY